MATWTSPNIPYPVTPLDRGSGFVPSIGNPDSPIANHRFQVKVQHTLEYTYQKTSMGRNPTSAQRLVEQTYHKTSLGRASNTGPSSASETGPMGNYPRMTRILKAAKAVKYAYHSPLGSLSRMTRIIQSAHFGPH